MKKYFIILLLLASLTSCDFICPDTEEDEKEDKSNDSTAANVQIKQLPLVKQDL